MTDLLRDKVAIVTGATGGIGRAVVEKFIDEGAKVVLADIAEEAGAAMAVELGDSTTFIRADVADGRSVEALIAEAVDAFGRLDIMHNNAGIVGPPESMLDAHAEGFLNVQKIDALSVLYGHKFAARQFREQGSGGSIITTASVAGVEGGWSTVHYTAAKHSAVGIVRQSAYELGKYGIRSNAIAPGVVMTDIQARAFGVPLERAREFNQFIVEKIGDRQAMARFGVPADIANVATFLASDLSSYVNGVVLPVDGGANAMTMSTFDSDILEVRDAFLAQ